MIKACFTFLAFFIIMSFSTRVFSEKKSLWRTNMINNKRILKKVQFTKDEEDAISNIDPSFINANIDILKGEKNFIEVVCVIKPKKSLGVLSFISNFFGSSDGSNNIQESVNDIISDFNNLFDYQFSDGKMNISEKKNVLPKSVQLSSNVKITLDSNTLNRLTISNVNGKNNIEFDCKKINSKSTNGGFSAKGLFDEITLDNTNGNCTVDGKVSELYLKTVNGSIAVNVDSISNRIYRFKTVNGRIMLNIPKDSGLEYDLSNVNGSISIGLGKNISKSRRSLKGKIGSEKKDLFKIKASSVNGNITVSGH